MKKSVFTLIVVIILLLIWEVFILLFKIDSMFLPSPIAVFSEFFKLIITWDFWHHILSTLARTMVGFSIATFIGLILGVFLGIFKGLYRIFEPIIDFFRSIPATALFPLFIFFTGVGDESKILVVIYGCAFIVLINTVYGIRSINRSRISSMKLYGFSPLQIVRYVIIPEAMPSIYSGLKISMSLSLVLIVVTEMFIGTNAGLGFIIIQYQMVYKIVEMYCAVLAAGLMGIGLNKTMLLIESKALHWAGR